MTLRLLTLVPALLAALAVPLRAQAVRGQVVDDAARPVAAAFVILLDAAGRSVAREALAVSAWTERAESLHVVATQFARSLDRSGKEVITQQSRSYEGPTLNPFVTLEPEDLASAGYRRTEGEEAWYHAPDAGVPLSDAFLDTHCFRTVRGRAGTRGLLGLAFEPVQGRRVTDVAGTLWIDPRTAELRHLDFLYRNLPRQDDWRGVGGRVEFRRLPTGAWIVERWRLRLPAVGRRQGGRLVLQGYREVGGEVHSVSRRGPAADSAAARPGVR